VPPVPQEATAKMALTASRGPRGELGQPGEVTLQQLTDAINISSGNSNAVDVLSLSVSDSPKQGEVQTLVNKVGELIQALRR